MAGLLDALPARDRARVSTLAAAATGVANGGGSTDPHAIVERPPEWMVLVVAHPLGYQRQRPAVDERDERRHFGEPAVDGLPGRVGLRAPGRERPFDAILEPVVAEPGEAQAPGTPEEGREVGWYGDVRRPPVDADLHSRARIGCRFGVVRPEAELAQPAAVAEAMQQRDEVLRDGVPVRIAPHRDLRALRPGLLDQSARAIDVGPAPTPA